MSSENMPAEPQCDIRSMTGFGRSEKSDAERRLVVEMKSVNHRYCDITIKMPKRLGALETAIRNTIRSGVERGKVDVFISYEDYSDKGTSLKYNQALAAEYMRCFEQMASEFDISNDISVSQLSRFPEVLVLEEQQVDEKELWDYIGPAVREACDGLTASRRREGMHLRSDLLAKLDVLLGYVDGIEERSPQIVAAYQARLTEKVQELLGDAQADSSRIAMETTLYADKLSVDEEIVRLRSHIQTMRACLNGRGAVGRKLDFLAQEMNREANTILSKANDLIISETAIGLKTDIEKVREQIQNIE